MSEFVLDRYRVLARYLQKLELNDSRSILILILGLKAMSEKDTKLINDIIKMFIEEEQVNKENGGLE